MDLKDVILEYAAKVSEVRNKIKKLSLSGIDSERYYSELDEIEKFINDKNIGYNLGGVAGFTMEMKLEERQKLKKVLEMLEIFEEKIDGYSQCEKFYLEVLKIKEKLSNEITEQEIVDYIGELLPILAVITISGTYDDEKIKAYIDEVYQVSLNIMKIEILRNGKSKLFNTLKNNQTHRLIISNLIKNELDIIFSDEENNYLFEYLKDMGIEKITFDYYDERLIFLLGVVSDDLCYDELFNKILKMKTNFETEKSKNDELINKVRGTSNIIKYKKEDLRENVSYACFRNIMTLVLVGSIALGGFGTYKLAKRASSNVSRKTTIESYSTLSDEEFSTSGLYTRYREGDIYLQEVSPLENGAREITTYLVRNTDNSFKYDDISEYFNYLDLFYNNYLKKEVVMVSNDDREFLSDEGYRVINMVSSVDKDDKLVIRGNGFVFYLILFLILYVLLLKLISSLLDEEPEDLLLEFIYNNEFSGVINTKKRIDELYSELKERNDLLNQSNGELKVLEMMYLDMEEKYGELMSLFEDKKVKTRKLDK